jgi:hypothetical protein
MVGEANAAVESEAKRTRTDRRTAVEAEGRI